MNAAIGRVQLKRLETWNKKRQEIAKTYTSLFQDIEELTLPPIGTSIVQPVHHLYVIRTKQRDQLKTWLESQGVSVGVHYALPIHLQPIYQEMFGFKEGAYPNTELLCKTCLSLPIYPDLTSEEIKFISEKIHEFFLTNSGKGKT